MSQRDDLGLVGRLARVAAADGLVVDKTSIQPLGGGRQRIVIEGYRVRGQTP